MRVGGKMAGHFLLHLIFQEIAMPVDVGAR